MTLVLLRCFLAREERRKMMKSILQWVLSLLKKIGDVVQEGETLAISVEYRNVEQSMTLIQKHILIGKEAVESPRLVGEMITV